MSGTASTALAFMGLGVLLLAVAKANGRRVIITLSGGTLVALIIIAVLVGHVA